MKRRILDSFIVSMFLAVLVNSSGLNTLKANAMNPSTKSTFRYIENGMDSEMENDDKTDSDVVIKQTWNYYSDTAIRSVNNEIKSTYSFTSKELKENFGNYAKGLLGKTDFDSTDDLLTVVDKKYVPSVKKIMKYNSTVYFTLTNYTDKELEDKQLMQDEDNTSKAATDATVSDGVTVNQTALNSFDTGDATSQELMQALSYFIENDYVTLPSSITLKKATDRRPTEVSSSLVNGTDWYYAASAHRKENGKNVSDPNNMCKSDLIMLLSKAFCGVQRSAPIAIIDQATRKGETWSRVNLDKTIDEDNGFSSSFDKNAKDYYGKTVDGNGDVTYYGAQFPGDVWVYYSPNVYELYLTEAISDGIISFSEIKKDTKFYKENKGSVNKHEWDSDNFYQENEIPANAFGESTTITVDNSSVSIVEKKPSYFEGDEKMSMMEALRIIEAYMRMRDDNMSEIEEKAVRYKLGLSVLDALNEGDQKTITYLIAKGVLDSDKTSLFTLISEDATIPKLYTILYRAVNKSARFDFSTIQLTDSETVWANEGFAQDTFTVFSTDAEPVHETISVDKIGTRTISKKDSEEDEKNTVPDIAFSNFDTEIPFFMSSITDSLHDTFFESKQMLVNAASAKKDTINVYKIVKIFDNEETNVYGIGNSGDTIAKLYKDRASLQALNETKQKYAIKKIEYDENYEINGKKRKVYKVTFEVEAASKTAAMAYLEGKIQYAPEIDSYSVAIQGVTRLKTDGKSGEESVNMISQSALKKAFTKISVLEDKVLMNLDTGTLAYFSDDYRFALVGNQIVTSDYKVIFFNKQNNEVYYNLNVLMPLLSKAFVDVIGKQTNIVLTDVYQEQTVKLGTSYTDEEDSLFKMQYTCGYNQIKTTAGGDHGNDGNKPGYVCIANDEIDKKLLGNSNVNQSFYVKLNTLSECTSLLTKQFSTKYGDIPITGTIIVNFEYVVPNEGGFDNWLNTQLGLTDTITFQDAYNVINTSPKDLIKEHKLWYVECIV